jgi:hypothetical protein
MRILVGLGLVAIGLAVSACTAVNEGGQSASGTEQQVVQSTVLVDAKLYDEHRPQVDPRCDRYTHLVISKGGDGKLSAKVENALAGVCELHVDPNPRSYTVSASDDGCGSTVYEGLGARGSVRVQDNRGRECEDLRLSTIEVEEKVDGKVSELWGEPSVADSAPAPTSSVLAVKLYNQPNAKPSPGCDVFLDLVIGREGSKLVASLENKLGSTSVCEIMVEPDQRSYDVTESESCGSTVYEGKRGGDKLYVQDNASRVCEDMRVAPVEVTETRGGQETPYYGKR